MSPSRRSGRIGMAFILAAALSASGCCSYLGNRANDFADMFTMGVTVSSKPKASLYVSLFSFIAVGWSNFDGTLVGWCNRDGGVLPARQKAGGLVVWGYERMGYRDEFKPEDPNTPAEWNVGLFGLCGETPPPRPYSIICNKWLHIGFIGLTMNCRWMEIVDFFVGFSTADIRGDDTFPRKAAMAPAPEKSTPPAK